MLPQATYLATWFRRLELSNGENMTGGHERASHSVYLLTEFVMPFIPSFPLTPFVLKTALLEGYSNWCSFSHPLIEKRYWEGLAFGTCSDKYYTFVGRALLVRGGGLMIRHCNWTVGEQLRGPRCEALLPHRAGLYLALAIHRPRPLRNPQKMER